MAHEVLARVGHKVYIEDDEDDVEEDDNADDNGCLQCHHSVHLLQAFTWLSKHDKMNKCTFLQSMKQNTSCTSNQHNTLEMRLIRHSLYI